MPNYEEPLAGALPSWGKNLDIDKETTFKDNIAEDAAPNSPASTALPMSPLTNSGTFTPNIGRASVLAGDGEWSRQLDGLQRDLAAARVDLHLKEDPNSDLDNMLLVARLASWESNLRAFRTEAEDWRHCEREKVFAHSLELQLSRASAHNASANAEVQVLSHQRELQVQQQRLEELHAELQAAQLAKSELKVVQGQVLDLQEKLKIRDAEHETIFHALKKQQDALRTAETEIQMMRAENGSFLKQIQLTDDSMREAVSDQSLVRTETRIYKQQLEDKDAEHQAMLNASKTRDVSLQTMGRDLASVKGQLQQALDKEIQEEKEQEHLTDRCIRYEEAIQKMQEHGNALEVEMKIVEDALAASTASAKKRDEVHEEAKSKVKIMEEALARSESRAAECADEARQMKSLVASSDVALCNAESKQEECLREASAVQADNEAMEMRVSNLQVALTSSMKKQLYLATEVEEYSESQQLSISLHAKVQSLEAAVSRTGTKWAQLASSRALTAFSGSKLDYPRGMRSAQLRAEVLSARIDPPP